MEVFQSFLNTPVAIDLLKIVASDSPNNGTARFTSLTDNLSSPVGLLGNIPSRREITSYSDI